MALDLWFVQRDAGYRGWFSAKDGRGLLRSGLVAADATITIIAPDDSASTTYGFTESTQLSGIYYVDIPNTFLVTHGVGTYGFNVTVDTTNVGGSGGPRVIDSSTATLTVTVETLDTIPTSTDTVLSGTHGAGSWVGGGGGGGWDELVSDYVDQAGSFGEAIRLLMGQAGVNVRDTVLTSSTDGRPLTARRRVYDNPTDASLDQNARFELTIDATYAADDNDELVRLFGEAFEIATFALDDAAAVEIGTTVSLPSFTATYVGTPTTADLDDNQGTATVDVSGTPNAFATTAAVRLTSPNAAWTFTLTAGNGVVSDVANVTKRYRGRVGVGWTTDPGPYTDTDIAALNGLTTYLSADALFQNTLSPVNAYLVAYYHDDFNGAVEADFLIGTFLPGGASEVQSGLLLPIPGGTAPYTVVRSNLIQNGTMNWQRQT